MTAAPKQGEAEAALTLTSEFRSQPSSDGVCSLAQEWLETAVGGGAGIQGTLAAQVVAISTNEDKGLTDRNAQRYRLEGRD